MSSCNGADIVPDLAALQRQIEVGDPHITRVLAGSPEARAYVHKIQPGAQFYLGLGLRAKKLSQEALVFFRAQVETPEPAWKGPAFRAWLETQQEMKAWTDIVGQSESLFKTATGTVAGTQGAADAALSTQAWRQTMLESLFALGQIDQARSFARGLLPAVQADVSGTVGDELGQSAHATWLLRHLAFASALPIASRLSPLTIDDIDDIVPYVLGVDAAAGHVELRGLLSARQSASAANLDRVLLKVLQAKGLLSLGQAGAAYREYRDFLIPVGKATPQDSKDAQELQAGLFLLFDRSDRRVGLPVAFFRDVFNAARLSGQLSGGIGTMDQVLLQLVSARPNYHRSALRPYLLELKGRLLRAKNDHQAAGAVFLECLGIAGAQEKAGLFSAVDRRRIQWYALRSLTDQFDFPASGPGLDEQLFLAIAQKTDDPEYFADVFERAILLLGDRKDWKGLRDLYEGLSERMEPLLRSQCATVLARVAQLEKPATPASEKRFQDYSVAVRDQSESIYYRALALWMRGEPILLDELIATQKWVGDFGDATNAARPIAPEDYASQLAEGYISLGMLDFGATYIWEHRRDMGTARFARMGMHYVAAGRYRQGLRMLESLRVRFGHPADPALLSAFYPRPFEPELRTAVAGTVVPEWLMFSLVRTESNFDTGAGSSVGAQGLSQLMPATAKLLATQLRIESYNVLEPATNLRFGATFLQDQYGTTKQWPLALAAYNAGIGRVRGWIRRGMNTDPILFSELVPFDETRNYLRRIVESSLFYTRLYYQLEPVQVLSVLYKN